MPNAPGLSLDCHCELKLRAERGGSVVISFGGSQSVWGDWAPGKMLLRGFPFVIARLVPSEARELDEAISLP